MSGRTFSDISVGEIAATAGTSRSTFYLHFQDKNDVIEEMIDELIEELIDVSNMANDEVARASRDTVRMSLVRLAQVYRKHVASFSAISEVASTDPNINKRYRKMIERAAFVRRERVHDEKKRGTIRDDLSDTVPLALTWMVERTISQYITGKTKEAVIKDRAAMDVIDGLTDVIWSTLYGE